MFGQDRRLDETHRLIITGKKSNITNLVNALKTSSVITQNKDNCGQHNILYLIALGTTQAYYFIHLKSDLIHLPESILSVWFFQ